MKILRFIFGAIMLMPLILIANDNESFTPNLVGLFWLVILILLSRTKHGEIVKKDIKKLFKEEEKDDFWQ